MTIKINVVVVVYIIKIKIKWYMFSTIASLAYNNIQRLSIPMSCNLLMKSGKREIISSVELLKKGALAIGLTFFFFCSNKSIAYIIPIILLTV